MHFDILVYVVRIPTANLAIRRLLLLSEVVICKVHICSDHYKDVDGFVGFFTVFCALPLVNTTKQRKAHESRQQRRTGHAIDSTVHQYNVK